jgi:hypothetical protein
MEQLAPAMGENRFSAAFRPENLRQLHLSLPPPIVLKSHKTSVWLGRQA